MSIFVLTHNKGVLKMVGPFKAYTSVASIQQAQVWCSKWFAENMKDGDIPQWWIVEQDLADGATKVEIPLEAPTA